MIGILLAAIATASPYPSPITPAADGKIMCFRPDEARKTCASTGDYSDNGDGTLTNTATMLVSRDPVVVLQLKTRVTVKDNYVCGAIHAENIASGFLWVDGHRLSPDEAQPRLDRLTALFSGILDKDVCTTYVPSGDQLMSRASFDGKPFGVDAIVKWVSPNDGYTVEP